MCMVAVAICDFWDYKERPKMFRMYFDIFLEIIFERRRVNTEFLILKGKSILDYFHLISFLHVMQL